MNKWERVYVTYGEHVGDQSMRAHTDEKGAIWLWLGDHHGLGLARSAAEEIITLLQRELAKAKVAA